MFLIVICVILAQAVYVYPELSLKGKVVNGNTAAIEEYGYSAHFILLGSRQFGCGASIINQELILTAAHCFDYSTHDSKVIISVGDNSYKEGQMFRMKNSIVHEKYDPQNVHHDIALVLLSRQIQLGVKMHRIALARVTPKGGVVGKLAGWGIVKETPYTKTIYLHSTTQRVKKRADCVRLIHKMPRKAFCTDAITSKQYPAQGDSGSALVVNGYLQIGIVSYKIPRYSSVIVYTDVASFYEWIQKRAMKLECNNIER